MKDLVCRLLLEKKTHGTIFLPSSYLSDLTDQHLLQMKNLSPSYLHRTSKQILQQMAQTLKRLSSFLLKNARFLSVEQNMQGK